MLLKISVILILLTFKYLVALTLFVNNHLNSSLQHIIVTKISISLKITCNLSKIGQISDFQHGWLGGLDIAVLVHVLDFSGTHLSS